ncbi:hypothetical protein IAT38_000562 [Cryptococcus sp. DSM 104549]
MATPVNDYDANAELAARMGGLNVGDSATYASLQQPGSHSQSPVASSYPNVQTPTSRGPPYSPYGDQQGYPYYTASGGMGMPPPASYGYGAPVDMTPLQQAMQFDGQGFPAPGDMYGAQGQQDGRQTGAQQQQQGGQQGQQQPNGSSGRQVYRPPHAQQQAMQQQQQQQQQVLQQQANAVAHAGYYGYTPDQRSYWMPAQGMYVPGAGGERKKEGGMYQPHPRSTQRPILRAGIPQTPATSYRSHDYSGAATPASYLGSPSTLSYHQSPQAAAPQFGMHHPQQYGGITTYSTYQSGTGFTPARSNRRYEDSGVVRSALLEDFRLNKLKKWELSDIFGHIVEFAGDQHGSRFIQQKLETATPEDRQKLFDEILPNAYQLMTDVFGNYVTQKMFEHGDQIQKAALAKKMEGHVLALSMQMYGCRVVQKALEHVLNDQRAVLVSELEPHIFECVKSSNANHVVQRLINLGPPKSVPDAFIGHVEELAKHPYGCRVLQKTFENLSEEMKRPLLDEMHKCTIALTEDQFGNYVVQSVISVGAPEDRNKVIGELKGRITPLARHKFASNVVEKAITHADPEDRKAIINELVGQKPDGTNQVGNLLRDAYANFPLQTGLFSADPIQRQELLEIIVPLIPPLRHTPVGKRLEGRIAQLEAEGGVSTAMRKSLSSSTATSGDTSALSLASTGVTSPDGAHTPISGSRTPSGKPAAAGAEGETKAQTIEDLLQ